MIYDLIIIGVGPAGLTASIYASRYKLSHLVIGKQLGGELALAHRVENFPGFASIPGIELMKKIKQQVESLGAEVMLKEVCRVEKMPNGRFKLSLKSGEVYQSKALIAATGNEKRRLNINGEAEYLGRGVSYCTNCDAPFFKNKTVAVIGGSDAAVTGAIHLNKFAEKVYLICRGDVLQAEPAWLAEWQKIAKSNKGETISKANITEILGDAKKVAGVKLDKSYKGQDNLALDGVFIEIGSVPGTSLVKSFGANLDKSGHVITNDNMSTNIAGFFCAGDMTTKSLIMKQAITAAAQGAVAASSVYKFIQKKQAPRILGV